MDKTNAMRLLDAKKIPYTPFTYPPEITDGMLVAEQLGEDVRRVFKTLVTASDKGEHFVFCVPVCASLDLKMAAKAAGAKSVAMIKQKELEPLTGYIHGGCSPVGMKKQYPTVFHETAAGLDTVIVSAGRIGFQVELAPADLIGLVRGAYADIITEE